MLDCSVDNEYFAQTVECFSNLREVIGEKKGDLGKVWMISGYLDSHETITPEIAKTAYKSFMGKESKRMEVGKLMGADVFELWQLDRSEARQSILETEEDNSPAIAIIYPNLTTMNDGADLFYKGWRKLFCYRQKIFWAYSQCRKHGKKLHTQLAWINQTITRIVDSDLDWSEVKYSLKLCGDYVNLLEQMKIYNSAIADNFHNYQIQLTSIRDRASQHGDTDLIFLEEFSELVEGYQEQNLQDIEKYQASLSILENLRETVKSLVEIEQAESDRAFQKNIEIVGFGVGVASIVASSASGYIEAIEEIPPVKTGLNFLRLNPPQSHLLVAVGFGILTGAIASSIIALFYSRKRS